MKTARIVKEMRSLIHDYIINAESIGFVPTMGFLHAGHLSLVRRAKKENDVTVVSIYVNPLQFGPKEDFEKYPRNLNRDLSLLKKGDVDIVFTPSDREIYGSIVTSYELRVTSPKFQIQNSIIRPPDFLTNCLCGEFRPRHFEGVVAIVAKLFNIIQPSRAYFGQKDYQQCLVVKKLVEDLRMPVKIVICPTVREKDGLAMSSRNAYLTASERKIAPALFKTLKWIGEQIQNSNLKMQNGNSKLKIQNIKREAINKLANNPFIKVEYIEIRDAENLDEIKEVSPGQKIVIAGAIRIGKTRLIDNVIID